jgi:magnesium chelatase subunit I
MARPPYPFAAIVGQDELKLGLCVCAVDPGIGGVLAFGDRGTGKSTAVRALAALLPPMRAVEGCRYGCDPDAPASLRCSECALRFAAPTATSTSARTARAVKPGAKAVSARAVAASKATTRASTSASAPQSLPSVLVPVPVVDLPLGASEDRVIGSLDLEQALARGVKRFEPGLLARAHRGFLYIDEVNLLEDHLVDLLIDVAASGENVVEREGLSVRHPARFVLVGSGNPEEGELRPQLLDRFGLAVDVRTPTELALRVEVVKRRAAYELDAEAFVASWAAPQAELRERIVGARRKLAAVATPDAVLESAASLCMKLGTDGLRGELTLVRAARALAAFDGARVVDTTHLARLAQPALRHRLRRNPLDDSDASVRVARAVQQHFGTGTPAAA